jgi:branched-subunit amino acid transport protein AzlD
MDSYIWGVILVGSLATFATRALPFVVLGRYAQHPLLRFLGRYLPPVLMVLLVVYATADLAQSLPSAAIVALSTLSVALLQWRFKNPLISIFAGSLVYGLMI